MSAGPRTSASDAATSTALHQTLFGVNAPDLETLSESENALGVRAAVVGSFADFAHSPEFPAQFARDVNDRGAVPLISWEPWDSWRGGSDQPAYALPRITAGDHDALIDRWAADVRGFGHPVMLRFAAEMNGDWLPWSTGVNGNRPGDYVAAWRHVRARFARAGATNAVWVWNPIADYDGATPLRELYPGDAEVDWLAVDGYNWGNTRAWGWQSYADVFVPTVAEFASIAPGKPVMIAEIGCAPDRRKARWVTDTLASARADGVDAVIWFEFNKETDWRLSATTPVAKAARTTLAKRPWRQGGDLPAIERAVLRR